MLHRSRLVFGVALAAAVLLLGCGDDDDDANGANGANGDNGTAPTVDPGGALQGESVDVLGIWGADELPNFEAMVAPWESEEGAQVDFTGTRDLTAILTTRVEGGNPPDIAIPAEIGLFQQFASDGELTPLSACGLEDQIRAEYSESFVDLGSVDGTLYGFFMKADSKGTVWYDPSTFEENGWEPLEASASFADLVALSDEIAASGLAPWSIGLESEGASGWPGSDWIQQIIINEEGEDFYDQVASGEVAYTDERVKAAWEMFGEIALNPDYTSQGGPQGINATAFQASSYPPFEDPPEAAMLALGGFASAFITEQFSSAVPGEDFDFFDFPGGKVTGGANIVYAFNDDPATCALLEHLASGDAQQIWVEEGGFTSVNSNVETSAYPDEVTTRVAQQLLEAEVFRFDLDDILGGATQQAIFTGVTEYLADPSRLDEILSSVEATR